MFHIIIIGHIIVVLSLKVEAVVCIHDQLRMRRKDHIKQSADLELKGHQMTERGSEINFRNCEPFAIFLLHASLCIFVYFKVEIVIVNCKM